MEGIVAFFFVVVVIWAFGGTGFVIWNFIKWMFRDRSKDEPHLPPPPKPECPEKAYARKKSLIENSSLDHDEKKAALRQAKRTLSQAIMEQL